MTLENPNWKNVGNWHWREKNCIHWAKEFLDQNLIDLQAERSGNDGGTIQVKITAVDQCDGDAALHVRKGNLITIYDLSLVLKWSGSCGPDVTASGSIEIPEVAHDTDEKDYTFHISLDNQSKPTDKIKDVVRKELKSELLKVFKRLGPELIQANSTDIYIENATKSVDIRLASLEDRRIDAKLTENHSVTSNATTTPSTQQTTSANSIPATGGIANANTSIQSNTQPTSKASAPVKSTASKTNPKTSASVSVCEIKKSTEFFAHPEDVFASFFDPQRVSVWSQGGRSDGKEKGEFHLFAGMVNGVFEKIDSDAKLIQLKWRLQEWPTEHYSTVHISFAPTSSSTMCNLKHGNVPISFKEKTQSVWEDWYFKRMKGAFGWGGL